MLPTLKQRTKPRNESHFPQSRNPPFSIANNQPYIAISSTHDIPLITQVRPIPPTQEKKYGFLAFLVGRGGFICDVFFKVEYKCLLAALASRFEFEQGGKRKLVSGGFFVYFINIICYQGMKEGWRARMRELCAITRCSKHYHTISPSKVIIDNHTITTFEQTKHNNTTKV